MQVHHVICVQRLSRDIYDAARGYMYHTALAIVPHIINRIHIVIECFQSTRTLISRDISCILTKGLGLETPFVEYSYSDIARELEFIEVVERTMV